MRILQLHNEYRVHGGENVVVEREAAELAAAGHDVIRHIVSNDAGPVETTGSLIVAAWNPFASRRLARVIESERPDVMHVHNTWFRLSPSTVMAASRAGVPVVHTLHNSRWLCVNGQMVRNGEACQDCVSGGRWSAVKNSCYRSSRSLSIVAAATGEVAERTGTWQNHIDRFIALTPRARENYVGWGFPADRVVVRPHRVDDPGDRIAAPGDSETVLYVGRLSEAKGIEELCRRWSSHHRHQRLVVIGDGPLREDLGRTHPHISFLGHLPHDEVLAWMLRSRALMLPTQGQEAFGLVVAEAMACGLPVALSDVAMISDYVDEVDSAWTFSPSIPTEWDRIGALIDDDAGVTASGKRARTVYERHFAADDARSLLAVYDEAIAHRSSRTRS